MWRSIFGRITWLLCRLCVGANGSFCLFNKCNKANGSSRRHANISETKFMTIHRRQSNILCSIAFKMSNHIKTAFSWIDELTFDRQKWTKLFKIKTIEEINVLPSALYVMIGNSWSVEAPAYYPRMPWPAFRAGLSTAIVTGPVDAIAPATPFNISFLSLCRYIISMSKMHEMG